MRLKNPVNFDGSRIEEISVPEFISIGQISEYKKLFSKEIDQEELGYEISAVLMNQKVEFIRAFLLQILKNLPNS